MRRPRLRRLPGLLLAGLVALAIPAAASDRFQDVGTDAVHHEAVDRLGDAGLTAGCAGDPPRFCSDDPLVRRQMALFLDRIAPRSASAASAADLRDAANGGVGGTPVTVTIATGGAAGGTGMVTLHGSVSVSAASPGSCPCQVEAFVYRIGDEAQGPSSWGQLPAELAGGRVNVALPVTWGVAVPTASEVTFGLGVFVDGSPAGARADGTLTAVWTPYRG